MSVIWDNLPECILDNVYEKVIYNYPENLLEDIRSYVLTIKYIERTYLLIDDILWYILLTYNEDLKYIDKYCKFANIRIKKKELKYIKKYIKMMTPFERYKLLNMFLYNENLKHIIDN